MYRDARCRKLGAHLLTYPRRLIGTIPLGRRNGGLIAASMPPIVRNHRLDRGLDAQPDLLEVGQIAEEGATARDIDELAQRRNIDWAITRTLVGVVDHGVTIVEGTASLLALSVKSE